jgi:hypothetical protein
MKKYLFVFLLFLFSCGHYGHISQAKQFSNDSFLSFTGNLKNVYIVIDDGESFTPKEYLEEAAVENLYQISSGIHKIQVFKNDVLIINEKFYIGKQEIKEINVL